MDSGRTLEPKFFRRRLQYVMVQRTYKVPGGPNDCICVMSPFSAVMDTEKRELQKTFTYRNLSSTQKLHEDLASNASYWPIAKFRMQFYETHIPPKQMIVRKKKYNFANSTTIMSAYGYALDPPFWQFLYSRDTCAVVNVLPITFIHTASVMSRSASRQSASTSWMYETGIRGGFRTGGQFLRCGNFTAR
nr:uncharacterized protein LOC126543461 [Dermacentor andersoni]